VVLHHSVSPLFLPSLRLQQLAACAPGDGGAGRVLVV
jgi:hypothetical protein